MVFSADDFGLDPAVNEAVQVAHEQGVLMQASLMVAAAAATNAIERARTLPDLNVGLHLVLVDGDSLLGHARLPHITAADGRFSRNQLTLALKYFFSPAARREMAAEIRAQFAAYAATGLPLHHADAHKHMHLHPTVGAALIRIGRLYALPRLRVPAEPPAVLRRCGGHPTIGDHALYAWSFLLRRQCRRAGIATAAQVFGIHWSGAMTTARVTALLRNLGNRPTEIYFHPATEKTATLQRLMPDYQHATELQTLLDLKLDQADNYP